MDNTSRPPDVRASFPDDTVPTLRMVFWELTNACNLSCAHCRARPAKERSSAELSTEEAKRLLDDIAAFAQPAVVLSGGEPLVRPDWAEIARYGTVKGLRVLLATNGSLVSRDIARQMVEVGIKRISVSIDAAGSELHDRFRGVQGAFDAAWQGITNAREAGLEFQINTTVTRHNLEQIPRILELAVEQGAAALHLFLLVPTGCGFEIADEEMIKPEEYEQVLGWLYEQSKTAPIGLRATCAPHYYRIARQRSQGGCDAHNSNGQRTETKSSKGCLAGSAVCFVSHSGEVYPCGYLPVSAGNVRRENIANIWRDAEVFKLLRDEDNLEGKCGRCEYRRVCMGCRARAYAMTGSFLAAEPYCVYQPRGVG
ncbi:MAG: radical SAM protein [Armatimonadota bacterium]|nr:radical SAM protein [Armatimonadota bacterium]